MSEILYSLRRFFSLPLELINGPRRFLEDMWRQSDKSRSLVLGLPAIVVAIIGLSALGLAEYGVKGQLENRYASAVEAISKEKRLLIQDISKEGKVINVASQNSGDVAADPRKEQLVELRQEEQIYLNKLITMNPSQPEYRYDLAMAVIEDDPGHAVSIMKQLAPEDEAGYAKAHAWLAGTYMTLPVTSAAASQRNAGVALIHADHCLKRDKDNRTAKLIKGQLHFRDKRYPAAYEVYNELFEEDPRFYEPLVRINELMEREDRNTAVLEKAISKYRDMLRKERLDETRWVAIWDQMLNCYTNLQNFKSAESLVLAELEGLGRKTSTDTTLELQESAGAKLVFLKNKLANIYLAWSKNLLSQDAGSKTSKLESLEILKRAYRYNPRNASVLRLMAKFAMDADEEIAAQAKEVYDPLKHTNAPASVLNELGTGRLLEKRYDEAVKFFELARKKEPKNPTILNNLAYSWLLCEEQDPERALQLVDEGLRFVKNRPSARQYYSHFLDTRGNALMKLGRYEEAVASLEQALNSRPNAIGLLEQLVDCYRELGLDPETYVRKVKKLKAVKKNEK